MWSPILDFLKAIWPSIVGAIKLVMAGIIGKEVADGRQNAADLAKVADAAEASRDNRDRLVDERLRDAKQRRLYRVSDGPPVAK